MKNNDNTTTTSERTRATQLQFERTIILLDTILVSIMCMSSFFHLMFADMGKNPLVSFVFLLVYVVSLVGLGFLSWDFIQDLTAHSKEQS
ncbi:hypothetical protein ACHEUQ_03165 [Alloscardovia omnicolens]|uniref:hypothetical protein n=1 Tax=Alloscardovia omnicolens TaxID=419015 RepID=UPI003757C716